MYFFAFTHVYCVWFSGGCFVFFKLKGMFGITFVIVFR